MLERDYLKNVRRELLARGIWGNHALTLVEQLGDHYRETVQALRSEGAGEAAAQQRAVETIGTPATVANAAAGNLPGQSKVARRPWLFGIAMFIALVASTPLIMAAGYYLCGLHEYTATRDTHALNLPVFYLFAFLVNWLPFLLGISFLAWVAWKKPTGWKPLIIASLAIGLATGCLSTNITPPLHGYHSGNLTLITESWITAIGWLVSPEVRQTVKTNPLGLLSWIASMKVIFPVVACIALRRILRKPQTA